MPTSHSESAQPRSRPWTCLGPGVGGEVEVVAEPAEQGVAHAAAHEREVVAGRLEPAAELVGHRRHPQQLADGAALHLGQRARARARSGRAGVAVIRGGHGPSVGSDARPRPCGPRARARDAWLPWRTWPSARNPRRSRRAPLVRAPGCGRSRRPQPAAWWWTVARPATPVPRSSRATTGGAGWSGPCPKGHVEAGETPEDAAVREVEEETGILGRVLAPLGTIDFWFVAEDRRVHKTVHHHLLEAVSGELSDEDIEVVEVAWVPLEELATRLAYADERALVDKALGPAQRERVSRGAAPGRIPRRTGRRRTTAVLGLAVLGALLVPVAAARRTPSHGGHPRRLGHPGDGHDPGTDEPHAGRDVGDHRARGQRLGRHAHGRGSAVARRQRPAHLAGRAGRVRLRYGSRGGRAGPRRLARRRGAGAGPRCKPQTSGSRCPRPTWDWSAGSACTR